MSDYDLTVTLRSHPAGSCLLAVAGGLDHHTAPRLRKSLNDLPRTANTPVIIGLSELIYCDSTGITVLVTAYHLARATGAPWPSRA